MGNSFIEQSIHEVKNIFVYLNGIENSVPRKALIDPKKLKNWSRILDHLTEVVQNVIIVQKVFTEDGYIVTDFSELQNFKNYIVSDRRNFIHLENGYVYKKYMSNQIRSLDGQIKN